MPFKRPYIPEYVLGENVYHIFIEYCLHQKEKYFFFPDMKSKLNIDTPQVILCHEKDLI